METFDFNSATGNSDRSGDGANDPSGAVATITQVRGVDWTGHKRITLRGRIPLETTTVGDLAEEIRERLGMPPGNYDVYYRDEKLNRTAALSDVHVVDDAELELTVATRAGHPR